MGQVRVGRVAGRRSTKARGRKAAPRFPAGSCTQGAIGDFIQRLLPQGTRPGLRPGGRLIDNPSAWETCPGWPPDLFAVAASLVRKSDCYALLSRAEDGVHTSVLGDKEKYLELVKRLGQGWCKKLVVPGGVQKHWAELLRHAKDTYHPEPGMPCQEKGWWRSAIRLMAIADEAASGLGFVLPEWADYPWPSLLVAEYGALLETTKEKIRLLHQIPSSICWLVPQEECCVLPKTRTPQVGVTLQALSHNLALLPPATEVRGQWLLHPFESEEKPQAEPQERENFNILLVPFPYRVPGASFQPAFQESKGGEKFFATTQEWLPPGGVRGQRKFAEFVRTLIVEAEKESGVVNAVILPELALDMATFKTLQETLAARTKVEILISGVLRPSADGRGIPENAVKAAVLLPFEKTSASFFDVSQSKHHRWKLDGGQIRRYNLGNSLSPKDLWWEGIAVSRRSCSFFVFRAGATLCALVCEDLARVDPVQPVLRSVGPNLVVAVLMDGAQIERRWSGRYATALADDPGSSVLTLTSLGMVRRAAMPGDTESREIALWKESGQETRELKLPVGSHGLLISCSLDRVRDYSLDGRDDGGAAVHISLGEARGVVHPDPPSWLTEPLPPRAPKTTGQAARTFARGYEKESPRLRAHFNRAIARRRRHVDAALAALLGPRRSAAR